ncbi:hypothetical protein RN001_005760 [Aquatica leii]|uniref:Uncharacterized protein n=1 Tax=Aquatica leii TaxID=1421715 RepID=A0AAN7PKB4_9COLE|nr:hypothetical protein RN001_005760 [Aquatica leii]
MDILLSITNEKTILGLDNPVDGDSLVIEPEIENKTSDLVLTKIQMHSEVTATSNNTTDWGNHTSNHLRTPISEKLKAQTAKPVSDYEDDNWSNRRRPGVIKTLHTSHLSKVYSEVGDLKKEYFKYALEVAKNKELRDIEEFELRKKNLNLDIQIKEAKLRLIMEEGTFE